MNMSSLNTKDPAFKLFGRNIPVPDTFVPVKDNCSEITKLDSESANETNWEEQQEEKEESDNQVTSAPKQEHAETNSADQEKIFKKPDKIIPCPRCNSLETKFCYFNNYNVNQPRHFCKNCQRYWTAGGTMRNVPIGAGRRKNKHLASQYRQLLVSSDGMPVTRIENADSSNYPHVSSVDRTSPLRTPAGTPVVLKFGPEAPLCESMENVLNLGEQKKYAELTSVSSPSKREEPSSSVSSVSATHVQGNDLPGIVMKKEQMSVCSNETKVHQSMHCYPIRPLVFPWNPGWTTNAASAGTAHYPPGQSCNQNGTTPGQVQWCPTPMMAVPGFCPPNIPVQFVPAPYWGCMPLWAPGTGNVPPNGSSGCLSPSSSNNTSCCTGNGSPTLGKHSRDSNCTDDQRTENCILVPKTLRIDDLNEASKSPLWSTLGIEPDQKDPVSKGTIFKASETKKDDKDASESSHILGANPAALSRSHTFQESS